MVGHKLARFENQEPFLFHKISQVTNYLDSEPFVFFLFKFDLDILTPHLANFDLFTGHEYDPHFLLPGHPPEFIQGGG